MKTFLVILVCVGAVLSTVAEPVYLSPSDIDRGKDCFYVTASTGMQVLNVDAESMAISSRIEFPVELAASVLSKDGKTLFVTGGGYEGTVFAVDTASGKILKKLRVGHTPMSPVLSPDGKTLHVCNRFSNTISSIDLTSWNVTSSYKVTREPVAMDISPDGRYLFVANHIPAGRDHVTPVDARVVD